MGRIRQKPPLRRSGPLRVGVLVLDRVTDSGVSVALDVLRAANALVTRAGQKPPFVVEAHAWRGRSVTTAAGLRLRVHADFEQAERCDVLLVPGCWLEQPADVTRFLDRADVEACGALLARAHRRGAVVGSSCSGAFVVAHAGLLDGRHATTTWWLGPEFRRRFPAVTLDETRSLVREGRLLSAGTVFAMADLSLALVAQAAGPTVARQVMRVLLLDAHASQGPYMALTQLAADDPRVRAVEAWVRRHLSEPFSIAQVARAVGLSPRTLARRLDESLGLSPIAFVQRLRVEQATQLLETTRLPFEQVALRVGYGDAGTLRRLLRRAGVQVRRPTLTSTPRPRAASRSGAALEHEARARLSTRG
ncbi:MAG: helix-turn-helix domain-containing protein [Myxococcaceae bacterium]|jgi:transcriptional regulator GlxA family with amidase domain|nr:helix-turn-helix domain-containing protein [Myxococcaceae bacterium]